MRTLLILLLSTLSCVAGADHSIKARLDGWQIDIDTAGAFQDLVVTRVFISRPGDAQRASLELPGLAFSVIWEHLAKLPKKRKNFHELESLKKDFVALILYQTDVIADDRALGLMRLWLDSHRAAWIAPDSPELQAALRTGFFPPELPKAR